MDDDEKKKRHPAVSKEYAAYRKDVARKRRNWKARVSRKSRAAGRLLLVKEGICPRCMESLANCGCDKNEVLQV